MTKALVVRQKHLVQDKQWHKATMAKVTRGVTKSKIVIEELPKKKAKVKNNAKKEKPRNGDGTKMMSNLSSLMTKWKQ